MLKYDTCISDEAYLSNIDLSYKDLARSRFHKSCDYTQAGCLAGSARSQDSDKISLLDCKLDILKNLNIPVAAANPL